MAINESDRADFLNSGSSIEPTDSAADEGPRFPPGVVDLLEHNHAEISKLQDGEVRRMLKAYQEARRDLRDRLDSTRGGTFTQFKLTGALAQVNMAITQMQDMMLKQMQDAGTTFAEAGIDNLLGELKKMQNDFGDHVVPININATKVASDSSSFLFNKHQASLEAYGADLRSMFAQQLLQASIQEVSIGEVVHKIGQFFQSEEWRLERLVRTEMMGIYSFGKFNGMKEIRDESIADLKKTLFHPMDKRTGKDSRWLAQHNPIVDLDKPFVEDSTGKERVYMFPPNRPNDRAILVPYRDAWKSR